jgi:hypothetical protein
VQGGLYWRLDIGNDAGLRFRKWGGGGGGRGVLRARVLGGGGGRGYVSGVREVGYEHARGVCIDCQKKAVAWVAAAARSSAVRCWRKQPAVDSGGGGGGSVTAWEGACVRVAHIPHFGSKT